jgi:hypothetical protein
MPDPALVRGANQTAIETLRRAGIRNPTRLAGLVRAIVDRLELNLAGLVVLTEAASGPYVVTPILAALGGAARVLALTGDSAYGTAETVLMQTRALETLVGTRLSVDVQARRSLDLFAQADLVTNLGFVRPIDAESVAAMKPTAVVSLMCEAWEFRPGDLDLEACERRGIRVFGTNESSPGLNIFDSSGWLCLKLLLDAQIQPHKSRIVVVSPDRFGIVIERVLVGAGASVLRVPRLQTSSVLAEADALVIADYCREDTIIGPGGDVTASDLARVAPATTVIQFAGRVDVQGLIGHGLAVVPGTDLPARRMAMTLAGLGPQPVVELHAAGLKVGEMALRPDRAATDPWIELAQPVSVAKRCE